MQIWLNYHHLLYFKTIAETGSLARASEVLRVGQSALSMQLKSLEDRLEQPLFERKQKKLVLTEAGKIALDYAQQIFGLGTEMLDTLADGKDHGVTHVQVGIEEGVPHFAAQALLSQMLESKHAAPAVTHGAADALVEDLAQHRLDLLLLLETPHTKAKNILFQKRVMERPLLAVTAPAQAGLKKGFPQTLGECPLILPSPLGHHRHEIERYFHDLEIPLKLALETDETELQAGLAAQGHGIAFLPEEAVKRQLQSKELVSLGSLPVTMELWLVGQKRKMGNAVAEELMKNFSL